MAGKDRDEERLGKPLSPWMGLLLFLALVYGSSPFRFGIKNNVEEVPLVLARAGAASYPNDPFVAAHATRFTQASAYVNVLAGLTRAFGVERLPWIFFVCHVITMIGLYLSLRSILLALGVEREILVLTSVLLLRFLDMKTTVLPGARWIFSVYLDPELVVQPFVFGAVGALLGGRRKTSALLLLLGTLVHPLYTIPSSGAFVVLDLVRREAPLVASRHLLLTVPYALGLFVAGLRPEPGPFDTSRISEIVRAPHHCHLPSPFAFWSGNESFFGAVFLLLLGIFWLRSLPPPSPRSPRKAIHEDRLDACLLLALVLLAFMLGSIVANGIVRIGLLVKITPLRAGTVVFPLTLFVLIGRAWARRGTDGGPGTGAAARLVPLVVALLTIHFGAQAWRRNEISWQRGPQAGDLVRWVEANTAEDTLFLNYSDFDLRTHGMRSDWFRFKNWPLTDAAQEAWYERLLVYFDVPASVPPTAYERVRGYVNAPIRPIDVETVISRMTKRPNFVLLPSTLRTVDAIHAMAMRCPPFPVVFRNRSYVILSVP